MKRLIIIILTIVFLVPALAFSQDEQENTEKKDKKDKQEKEEKVRDHGLIFLLGPAINYHYGAKEGNTGYSDSRISWQVDGQLGIISTRHNTNRGNYLGAFGSFGSLSSETLQELADRAGREIAIKPRQFNQFYSLEGGMIVFNFIRISGGMGRQFCEDIANNVYSINYFSLTGGLNFNFGAVNLGLNANLLTGDDLAENQLRFSAGILVKF